MRESAPGGITAGSIPERRNLLTLIGTLARVGPNQLITDDPELLKRMAAVRSEYTRSPCAYQPRSMPLERQG